MSILENFNNLRKLHLTNKYLYRRYKKHLLKKKPDCYKIEINMCKYFMTGSKKFLKKNLVFLNKHEIDEHSKNTYKSYVNAFLTEKQEDILAAWDSLNNEHYLFFFNYEIIKLTNEHFELKKCRRMWNDIELIFDSEAHYNLLLKEEYPDFRFNSQLALLCFKFDSIYNNCVKSIKERNDVSKRFIEFDLFLDEFRKFLENNFVVSEYVDIVHKEFLDIFEDFNKNRQITVRKCFVEVKEELKTIFKRDFTTPDDLRKIIFDLLEKRIKVDSEKRNLPLLPVFYDLAHDFISYPDPDDFKGRLDDINIK